jgi:hypothetical protein
MGANFFEDRKRSKKLNIKFLCWSLGFDIFGIEPDLFSYFECWSGNPAGLRSFRILSESESDLLAEILVKGGKIVRILLGCK